MTQEAMKRAWATRWSEQLADNEAQAAREKYCRGTTAAMNAVGRALYGYTGVVRDDRIYALSLVVRMGGSLASGACTLLDAHNAYATAALARQFVEVEYLLWSFADDPDDMERWLHASRSQLGKRFQPKAMRERSGGVFRDAEYQSHCDIGGHPNPRGWAMLADNPPLDGVRGGWVDLGQHLERGWGLLTKACSGIGYEMAVATHAESVAELASAWHELDKMADRAKGPLGARFPDEE